MVIKHDIYLDKWITAKLDRNEDSSSIIFQSYDLKHYIFALEKTLYTITYKRRRFEGDITVC